MKLLTVGAFLPACLDVYIVTFSTEAFVMKLQEMVKLSFPVFLSLSENPATPPLK